MSQREPRIDSDLLDDTMIAKITGARPVATRAYLATKDALEPIAALLLAIPLLPLMALIALTIKATSSGPVIFRQTRLGLRGRSFTIYKFRTMQTDAEANGPRWWNPEDNRVTPLGRFLRASHMDELPQLWNVLKGDLGFVGPRPELPQFYDILEKDIPHFRARLQMKPGITGWAQIRNGYANTVHSSKRKLEYDLFYMSHISPVLDIQIVIDTLRGARPMPEDFADEGVTGHDLASEPVPAPVPVSRKSVF